MTPRPIAPLPRHGILVLALLGCAEEPGVGFDPFATAPACESEAGDGSIDLEAACASGVCAAGTYAEWAETLGPADAIGETSFGLRCEWNMGLEAFFDDADLDGAPDDDSVAGYFHITDAYAGRTDEGLGVGVGIMCFVDVLGQPQDISAVSIEDGYLVDRLSYEDPRVSIEDERGPSGEAIPDGYADEITVY